MSAPGSVAAGIDRPPDVDAATLLGDDAAPFEAALDGATGPVADPVIPLSGRFVSAASLPVTV